MVRRRVAMVVLGLVASVAAAVGPASSASAQPSNCWFTSPDSIWAVDYYLGVAGYCRGPGGAIEWFDFDGGYGAAWWM